MELFFGLLFSIFIISIIVGISLISRQRRRTFWRALAQQHGGTFVESKGLFSTTTDHVRLMLNGFEVYLDYYIVSHGKSSTTYQRVSINATSHPNFTTQIYQETPLFSKLGKAFGGQDIEVGDPAFDDAFIIKSDSPDRLLRSLDPDAMVEHLRQRHMRVELDGLTLTVARVDLTYELAPVEAQLRLATLYARGLFGPPAQLEAAQHREPAQPPSSAW